jgi:predicted amidohydrolase
MKTLKIAAVQMKFRATIAENLESISNSIAKAARAKCDAVLFPECALTGYNIDFSNLDPAAIEAAIQAVAQLARKSRINVLLGSPRFRKRKRFNSLIVLDRRGREVFQYDKIHLTARDAATFQPGNRLAFFHIDRVPCTAIICHERRFPELVRLSVMMGAQILFHANAGLDSLAVSKTKRNGRDGIVTRAFENQIYYVFANSVGPQGDNLWSAGDSKIVAPDMSTLARANNRDEAVIHATLDLSKAGRKYALEAMDQPAFLRRHWRALLATCRTQLKRIEKH